MKKAFLLAILFVAFLALAGMAANLAGFAVDSAEPQSMSTSTVTAKTLTMDTPAEIPTRVKRSIKLHGQPKIGLDTSREFGATLLLGFTRSPWS